MTFQLWFIAVWVIVGAGVGFYEARRGHWRWLWLLGAIAGPVAIPLAWLAQERERAAEPVYLTDVPRRSDGLTVLVGIDDSVDARTAARSAASLLGSRVGNVILATVVDYETLLADQDLDLPDTSFDPDRQQAEALLDEVAADLTTWMGREPTTVIIGGNPPSALEQLAFREDADLLVIGRRGHGVTKRLLGSCAETLTGASSVPVLTVPALAKPDETSKRSEHDEAIA